MLSTCHSRSEDHGEDHGEDRGEDRAVLTNLALLVCKVNVACRQRLGVHAVPYNSPLVNRESRVVKKKSSCVRLLCVSG